MRRSGRLLTLLLAALVCVLAILPGTAYAAPKTVVTVWSWFIQGTMDKVIRAFEAKHPDITIQYQYYNYSPQYLTALKAAAASDSLPDIIGLQPGSLTQQYRPYLAPLNQLAEKTWGKGWEKLIFPVNLKQMRMGNPPGDNNYYILPHESQVICIWYNVEIFKKLGLTVPKTLSELKAVAKSLSAHGYIPMYQGAADGWQNENVFLMIAEQIAPGLVDEAQYGRAPWTSPQLVKAMEVWRSLFTDGVFQAGALGARSYPTGAQLFAQGRVGMMALGSWWLQESRYAPPIPPLVENMKGFDFFYFPAIEAGGRPSPPIGGIDIGYGLTKRGAKNPAAWEFLASLVNGEGEQAALDDLNDLPAFTGFKPKISLTPNILSMYERFMNDLRYAHNQRFAYPAIADALDNALAAVAAGKESPASALKRVQAVTDKTLGR